jgi:hypothetical protein
MLVVNPRNTGAKVLLVRLSDRDLARPSLRLPNPIGEPPVELPEGEPLELPEGEPAPEPAGPEPDKE